MTGVHQEANSPVVDLDNWHRCHLVCKQIVCHGCLPCNFRPVEVCGIQEVTVHMQRQQDEIFVLTANGLSCQPLDPKVDEFFVQMSTLNFLANWHTSLPVMAILFLPNVSLAIDSPVTATPVSCPVVVTLLQLAPSGPPTLFKCVPALASLMTVFAAKGKAEQSFFHETSGLWFFKIVQLEFSKEQIDVVEVPNDWSRHRFD